MANQRITALTAMSGRPHPESVMCGVDTSDTTMSASGTTKKFTCGVGSGGLGVTLGSTDIQLGSNAGNSSAITTVTGMESLTVTSGAGAVIATSFTGDLVGDVIGDCTGNVLGDLTGNITGSSVLADGVTATTQSAGDSTTQVATTAFVTTAVGSSDTLAEVLANGNTTGSTNIIVSASQSITTDTIAETTTAAGVTIDSVLVKDNTVTATTFTGALVGNASTATALETARTIAGVSFDGTGNIDIPITGLSDVYGSMSPADGQVLTYNTANTRWQSETVTGTGSVTNVATSNGTFVNVTGGPITTTGTVTADLSATGTASGSTFLRGDNTWATPAGAGTVTSVATAGTVNGITLTGGTITETGTITLGGTLSVDLTADVTGTLPAANGGTGLTAITTLLNSNTEGTEVKSTGEGSGTKFLRENGDGSCSWQAPSGSGTVTSVAITGTDGIDVDSGSPITASGTITLGLSGIANAALTNSSVSYGGVSVALGASDATPAFDLSDATAYTGDSSLVATGIVASGTWEGTAVADGFIASAATWNAKAAAGANGDITSLTGLTTALTVAQGGTGATSLTDKAVLISQDTGTDAIGAVALTSNGQIIVGGADGPAAATITAGTNVSVTNGANSITIASTDEFTGTVTSVGGTGTVNGLTLTGTVTSSGNLTLGGTLPVEIGIACSDETTALEEGDNKARFMIPEAMTLTEVKASLSGADTGGSGVDIDVRYHATDPTNAGATVFSGGDLNIADSAFYGTKSSLAVTALDENSFIMVDINTTSDATGLKIWLIGTK